MLLSMAATDSIAVRVILAVVAESNTTPLLVDDDSGMGGGGGPVGTATKVGGM
jgi:hypothetical protein